MLHTKFSYIHREEREKLGDENAGIKLNSLKEARKVYIGIKFLS